MTERERELEEALTRLREGLEAIQGECYLWQLGESPHEMPDQLIEYLRRTARKALGPDA